MPTTPPSGRTSPERSSRSASSSATRTRCAPCSALAGWARSTRRTTASSTGASRSRSCRPGIAGDYLLREGRALAAIHHPGIVTVHTMGTHRGRGVPRDGARARAQPRPDARRAPRPRRAVRRRRGARAARRDRRRPRGRAPGRPRAPGRQAGQRDARPGRRASSSWTSVWCCPHADRAGHRSVAGSLQYMAPEALSGDVAEGAAVLGDVYALGVLALRAAHGSRALRRRCRAAGDLPGQDRSCRSPRERAAHRRPAGARRPARPAHVAGRQRAPAGRRGRALAAARRCATRLRHGGEERPFSVLVVDDDADVREALSLYVRAAAPNARDRVDRRTGVRRCASVRRRVPDLLLLDLDLPDINGIEVCMLLRGMQLGDACNIVSVSGRATARRRGAPAAARRALAREGARRS